MLKNFLLKFSYEDAKDPKIDTHQKRSQKEENEITYAI